MPQLQECENCGRVIGKLEDPYLHNDHVVCRECHGRLADGVEVDDKSPLSLEDLAPGGDVALVEIEHPEQSEEVFEVKHSAPPRGRKRAAPKRHNAFIDPSRNKKAASVMLRVFFWVIAGFIILALLAYLNYINAFTRSIE